MEIDGLPLHPLVVHSVVVFVPLAALFALANLVPRWQRVTRWPLLVCALIGAGAAQLAVMSGEEFVEHLGIDEAIIHSHEEWGERLQLGMWAVAALAFLTFVVTARAGRSDRAGMLRVVVPVVTAAAAVFAAYLAYKTGDSGARAVWGS